MMYKFLFLLLVLCTGGKAVHLYTEKTFIHQYYGVSVALLDERKEDPKLKEDDLCFSSKFQVLETPGCISSMFLENLTTHHTIFNSSKNTEKDCADYCAEKPEVFNLVAIARFQSGVHCQCLEPTKVSLDEIGPLVYCEETNKDESRGVNNESEVYYSLYCLSNTVLSGINIHYLQYSTGQSITSKAKPNTQQMFLMIHQELETLIVASEVISALLAVILIFIILATTYNYYWKKELNIVSRDEVKTISGSQPQYGTQGTGSVPETQLQLAIHNRAFQHDLESPQDELRAGNSTFYNHLENEITNPSLETITREDDDR
ncbi:uncharacterized protein LOC111718452 isoform X2 [Eurytemora carolleeae]|uniref:uncharacterized protein LOC111718452 isoform X2 n=1 Tax=Eurytemora carolleeae TaxID=1294199 RepID=UPI000C75A73A|nr:uncharacterized protein LOC111718452 isoform X2 [Eurytemora carolleeae]|eukprot:XP_023349830.1 uncharacterized protein LOC111718452 isoform X2 [Eurytemora affinis]